MYLWNKRHVSNRNAFWNCRFRFIGTSSDIKYFPIDAVISLIAPIISGTTHISLWSLICPQWFTDVVFFLTEYFRVGVLPGGEMSINHLFLLFVQNFIKSIPLHCPIYWRIYCPCVVGCDQLPFMNLSKNNVDIFEDDIDSQVRVYRWWYIHHNAINGQSMWTNNDSKLLFTDHMDKIISRSRKILNFCFTLHVAFYMFSFYFNCNRRSHSWNSFYSCYYLLI